MRPERPEFHSDAVRLREVAEFYNRERGKIAMLALRSGFEGAPKDDVVSRAVGTLGAGPFRLRLVVAGPPGSTGRGSVRVDTPPLNPSRAVHFSAAVAATLRAGGFDDVSVAVVDAALEGVAVRFDTDRHVSVVAYHGAEVGLQ